VEASAPENTRRSCYRHRDRETGVSCSSCGNPICTDCMTPTPVGMRCPDCARQRTKVRTAGAGSRSSAPIVAQVIIGICVAAWIGEIATKNSDYPLLYRGAVNGPYIAVKHEWWRIVTGGFLHDHSMPWGLLHIGFNMYLLFLLGSLLEPMLGRFRFALVYMTLLIGGSFGAVLLSNDKFSVGASGAVFGLMAVALMEMRSRGVPALQSDIGSLLILNLIITVGFANSISLGGHLGGLAAGAAVGFLLFDAGRQPQMRPLVVPLIALLGAALAVGTYVIATPLN
jgi:membrane associated rhomboid family serine protease